MIIFFCEKLLSTDVVATSSSVGRYSYFKQRLLPISKIGIIAIIVIFILKFFFFKCMITWTVNVVLGVYIGILVISTTTGHGGSVVSALA